MYKFLFVFLSFLFSCNILKAQNDLREHFTFYITPDSATVQSPGVWTIVIKAKQEIPANAKFKVKFIKGFGNLQNLIAIGANYTTANVSTPKTNIQINQILNSSVDYQPFWEDNVMDRIVTLTVKNGSIPIGDSIRIVIGHPNILSGRAMPPLSAFTDKIEIAASLDGSQQYKLSDEIALFKIQPASAFTLNLIAQTVFHTNQTGKLLISAADVFHNLATNFVGTVQLNGPSSDEAIYPKTVYITSQDSGKIEIPITFKKEGNYFFTATTNVSQVNVPRSNPIKVSNDRPFIYWGDLHSHGAPSRDAFGTGRYYYARYARGLDFFCATDHVDHNVTINGISDRDWAFQKHEVINSYEPGKFVSFIGYENSFLFPSGHYNIIFNSKNEDIPNIPIWPLKTFENIQNIWRAADTSNFDIITIPHHCGKVFYTANEGNKCLNCNTFGGIYKNPKYKMLLEIFSNHGLSESYAPNHNLNYTNKASNGKPFNGPHYAQDAWAIGERLGVISSSDDHFSHPGLPHNGIAAVLADELDRDPLFKSLKNKSSYGTTGDRIFIDFKINDKIMGSEVQIAKNDSINIYFEVLGTDQIDYVEILKWDFINGTYASGHPQYQTIATLRPSTSHPSMIDGYFSDPTQSDSAMYYLRVKQKNFRPANNKQYEIWGWSSPIWISRNQNIDTTHQDSLLFFKSQQQLRNISHNWEMSHQHQVKSYHLQQWIDEEWETIYTTSKTPSKNYSYQENATESGNFTYRLEIENTDHTILYSAPHTIQVKLDSIILKDARHESSNIYLEWENHLETNTTSYDVQLYDAQKDEFVTIKSFDANTNHTAISEMYLDTFITNTSGIYQFRLVQKFKYKDEEYHYWNIVEMIQTHSPTHYSKDHFVQLAKNPIQKGESLFLKSEEMITAQIWITDISGKIVQSPLSILLHSSPSGLALKNMPSGIYHINLKTNTQVYILPFIILP